MFELVVTVLVVYWAIRCLGFLVPAILEALE